MATTENTNQTTELSIADLQNIRTIIDAACRRGAFGGQELSSVGAAYDKLNNFLNSIAKSQTENQDANQQAPGA